MLWAGIQADQDRRSLPWRRGAVHDAAQTQESLWKEKVLAWAFWWVPETFDQSGAKETEIALRRPPIEFQTESAPELLCLSDQQHPNPQDIIWVLPQTDPAGSPAFDNLIKRRTTWPDRIRIRMCRPAAHRVQRHNASKVHDFKRWDCCGGGKEGPA